LNRKSLQRISHLRLREARTLLQAGLPSGAYYLSGYAVECALKSCVAQQTKEHDYPNKKLANSAYTHDLEALVSAAGLSVAFKLARGSNRTLELNWAVVKDWTVDSRYMLNIDTIQAKDMLSACTSRLNGVLTWIKKEW